MPWQNNGGWQGGGGKNPWGGGPSRGSGGDDGSGQPPNFDDMIRRGQSRLMGALPGGFKGPIGLLVVLLALYILFQLFTFTVDAREEGVVLRFGEFVRKTGPGLQFRLPYPIETVLTPEVQQQNRIDIGFRSQAEGRRAAPQSRVPEESLMLTGDENIVDVAFTIFWRIRDAESYLFNIQDPQAISVKEVAESAMREVIGRTPIQSALTQGRLQIELEVQKLVQTTLDSYQAGIEVTEVKLERVDPPERVIDAFRDVQAAAADRDRFRNEAEAYANSVIPDARGKANRIIQEAEAYREQIVAKAQGEAQRFLAVFEQYRQAKDITRKRIYLETMEEILSGMNKIIVDDPGGSGVVPYLPLPEIQARRKPAASQENSNE